MDLFPYTVAAQDIKVRSTDTRTEELRNPLIHMLGQRRVMLSHFRKLQGSNYPTSLFSLEPGIKGGSELSKQTDDLVRTSESAHESVAAEDVITDIASEEGMMPENSQADPGALNNVASTEIREAGDLIDVETSNLVEPSELEVLTSSTPGCTDLGLFLLNLVYCYAGLMRESCTATPRAFVRVSVF